MTVLQLKSSVSVKKKNYLKKEKEEKKKKKKIGTKSYLSNDQSNQ